MLKAGQMVVCKDMFTYGYTFLIKQIKDNCYIGDWYYNGKRSHINYKQPIKNWKNYNITNLSEKAKSHLPEFL